MESKKKSTIGENFVAQTSYCDFAGTDRRQGKPQPPIYWEADGNSPAAPLPAIHVQDLADAELWETMENRRSRRRFDNAPLTKAQLSLLCKMTLGVQEEMEFNGVATRRAVPSAGAKHAIETLLLVRRVEGIAPGLYRYLPQTHALVYQKELEPNWENAVNQAFASNQFQKNSAVTFFWVAVPARMVWHHGQRGYRNLYLDAGHIGQNLYLTAEGLGLAACTMCVFDDAAMQQLLGLEDALFLLYTAAVGGRVGGTHA